ncbi:MAG: NAD(P)/FAD-dependent oxidoreductase [Candidatus Bathyarchaeota archaeon]|nr:NAD(P)/FAD-dependent oxidoreductase [Candidatus Bathyarchaeota archaeon]
MKTVWDAVVVGGGPAGSFFAFELAKRGLSVCVFEEHAAVGLPSHCAGHLSIRSLRSLGLYPLPQGVLENTFSAANFYSPSGAKFSVHLSQPVTCAVNRARFDQLLAEKAACAGAEFCLGSRVESLVVEGGFVKGVNVAQPDGSTVRVSARLVVDAEGVSSRLLRQAGLHALNPEGLVYAVEAEVDGVCEVEEHAVEVYVGKAYAPNFYGWLIPRLDGTAKVGLAVGKGNPKAYFERLWRRHPVASRQLKKAKVKSMAFHAITLGGPIPQAYGNGFLAVGDCASQVKSTTGGGVIFSITCAKIAAEVAAEALQNGDLSADFLQLYQRRFMDALGFDVSVMLRARKALNQFSDEKLDRAVRFVEKVGFGKALRDIDEIDFQGQMLLSILKKPAAYATLAYLLAMYLPDFRP